MCSAMAEENRKESSSSLRNFGALQKLVKPISLNKGGDWLYQKIKSNG